VAEGAISAGPVLRHIAQSLDCPSRRPNGIFLLPLPAEKREPRRLDEHEYQRIRLGRAEKVLLSEAFSLQTTRGQWATKQISQWQELNAKKQAGVPLTREQSENHRALKQQMEITFEDSSESLHP